MGSSYVHSLETGTGTVSGGAVTLNKMTGVITSATTNLAGTTSESFTVTNSRCFTTSVILARVNTPGCSIVLTKVVPAGTDGSFLIPARNVEATACTGTYTVHYMIIN